MLAWKLLMLTQYQDWNEVSLIKHCAITFTIPGAPLQQQPETHPASTIIQQICAQQCKPRSFWLTCDFDTRVWLRCYVLRLVICWRLLHRQVCRFLRAPVQQQHGLPSQWCTASLGDKTGAVYMHGATFSADSNALAIMTQWSQDCRWLTCLCQSMHILAS